MPKKASRRGEKRTVNLSDLADLADLGGLVRGDFEEGWWSECFACGGRVEALLPARSGPCEVCGKVWALATLVHLGLPHGTFLQGRMG